MFYACPKISKMFITVTLASCRLLCHSNIRRFCSLVCLALSQHHAALVLSCALLCLSITLLLLSCALLCLSITLLLLSHVPCFVSASRCSCSLMCLALSQHHAYRSLPLSCALLCSRITLSSRWVSRYSCSFMCLALSSSASAAGAGVALLAKWRV